MKVTTKILIILAALPAVVSCLFISIVGMGHADTDQPEAKLEVQHIGLTPGECDSISLPICSTFIMDSLIHVDGDLEDHLEAELEITSPTAADKDKKIKPGTLVLPNALKKAWRISRKNNVLHLSFDASELAKWNKENGRRYNRTIFYMTYYADEQLEKVTTYPFVKCTLKSLHLPLLTMNLFGGDLTAEDSCSFKSLRVVALPYKQRSTCSLYQLFVDTLDLDLDNLSSWSVQESRVKVENIRGSEENTDVHYYPETGSEVLNWLPKTEKASIQLKSKGAMSIRYNRSPAMK
ncbi:MAG: hypothetical protein WCQ86_02545 [Bacteroidaceae bacterium]